MGPCFITSHTHNWVLFLLWLCLFILSGVISPLISSSILGTCRPGEFLFQCPIFLPFHAVRGVLKARILRWFPIPLSSGPHSVRTLHYNLYIPPDSLEHRLPHSTLNTLQGCWRSTAIAAWGSVSIESEVKSLSCVQLFATPWTVAYQASPSVGFSRQEYWSGLPFPISIEADGKCHYCSLLVNALGKCQFVVDNSFWSYFSTDLQ